MVDSRGQFAAITRYLRPVRTVSYTTRDMLQCVLSHVDPDDMTACTQLLGDKRGVIRVTLRTQTVADHLEDMVRKHCLSIKGVNLGLVSEDGEFVVVLLQNVPCYVTDQQIEGVMTQFGPVAGSYKDYVEFNGQKIENEKRRVLLSWLKDDVMLPREMDAFGARVFLRARIRGSGGRYRRTYDPNDTEPEVTSSSGIGRSQSMRERRVRFGSGLEDLEEHDEKRESQDDTVLYASLRSPPPQERFASALLALSSESPEF